MFSAIRCPYHLVTCSTGFLSCWGCYLEASLRVIWTLKYLPRSLSVCSPRHLESGERVWCPRSTTWTLGFYESETCNLMSWATLTAGSMKHPGRQDRLHRANLYSSGSAVSKLAMSVPVTWPRQFISKKKWSVYLFTYKGVNSYLTESDEHQSYICFNFQLSLSAAKLSIHLESNLDCFRVFRHQQFRSV